MQEAFQPIPASKKRSGRDFRPPPTLEDDFRRLLNHDIPHTNYTFELIHDWYESLKEDYEPTFIRAQQTPIEWKSKIGNSDMSTNFKTTYDELIYKGDIAVREDGTIYLMTWNVTCHPNNQATQILECNDFLTFVREHKPKTDKFGFAAEDDPNIKLDENGMEIIVEDMPCSHSEYAGRPDYSASQGVAGLTPDHLITCVTQWNDETRKIQIGDQCKIGNYMYRVISVYTAEVSMDKTYGVYSMHLRRVAGGGIADG